jgi:hypothetical protein
MLPLRITPILTRRQKITGNSRGRPRNPPPVRCREDFRPGSRAGAAVGGEYLPCNQHVRPGARRPGAILRTCARLLFGQKRPPLARRPKSSALGKRGRGYARSAGLLLIWSSPAPKRPAPARVRGHPSRLPGWRGRNGLSTHAQLGRGRPDVGARLCSRGPSSDKETAGNALRRRPVSRPSAGERFRTGGREVADRGDPGRDGPRHYRGRRPRQA